MDEFELIDRYFKRKVSSRFAVGLGDDCAVMDVDEGQQIVFSIDSLVPGVHFFSDDPSELIASRALCVSLSDLAAMGAKPQCFTLALSMPELDEKWLDGFSRGLFRIADKYHCELIGGDTVCGPLLVSVQVHGTLPRGTALTRSGANVGDIVCVSGTLGDGAAALSILQHKGGISNQHYRYLRERYYQPQPRFDISIAIRDFASAAIDISDGFIADLGHICRASGLGARIDLDNIPLSEALRAIDIERQAQRWSLFGGDDYQICFTVSPQKYEELISQNDSIDVRVVGELIDGSGVSCGATGASLSSGFDGYQHFSNSIIEGA